jgi:hypothetical protein
LYRFLSGYEPWSGKASSSDGGANTSKVYAAHREDFAGTGDELRADTFLILGIGRENASRLQQSGWRNGKEGDRPWQWFGPVTITTLPGTNRFGLTSDFAILAVDLGNSQYFLMFTGNQDATFNPNNPNP